jgi:hypothetical protein
VPRHISPPTPSSNLSDSSPQWNFGVYSLTYKSTNSDEVYYAGGAKQDLVFTAQLDPTTAQEFTIENLTFMLPLKQVGVYPPLLDNYAGPGAVPLSNLRFNALHGLTRDWLVVTMVPRSAKGISAVAVSDASFILSGVQLHTVEKMEALHVTVVVAYQNGQQMSTPLEVYLLPAFPPSS